MFDAVDGEARVNPHPHEDLEGVYHLYHGMGFYDDVHGKPLGKDFAMKARRFEVDFFKRTEVHITQDRPHVKQFGATLVATRWVDTGMSDDVAAGYGSRLVGREVERNNRFEFFAAIAPLESLGASTGISAAIPYGKGLHRTPGIDATSMCLRDR